MAGPGKKKMVCSGPSFAANPKVELLGHQLVPEMSGVLDARRRCAGYVYGQDGVKIRGVQVRVVYSKCISEQCCTAGPFKNEKRTGGTCIKETVEGVFQKKNL